RLIIGLMSLAQRLEVFELLTDKLQTALRFLMPAVKALLFLVKRLDEVVEPFADLVALGEDLLLLERLGGAGDLELEPAIVAREVDDLRAELRLRHVAVVRGLEAELEVVVLLDLTGELEDIAAGGLVGTDAVDGDRLGLRRPVVDAV